MKKILFLSFAYPYGHFGPSDNCTARIIDALTKTNCYEVYNISCSPHSINDTPNYKIMKGVKILRLPFPEKIYHRSYFYEHLLLLLKIPIYPLTNLFEIWRYYRACKTILKNEKFDLVVAQCAPHASVISAVLLKKKGYINKLVVIYWDNIYGKLPRIVIPKWFAQHRRRKLENWIAKYTDKIISPMPVKNFHDIHGDVEEAKGKRVYLEHPSIMRPQLFINNTKTKLIEEGAINIVYAGRIYDKSDVLYAIELLNKTSISKRINLILICFNIPSASDSLTIQKAFYGKVKFSGVLPFDELINIYFKADSFLAFSGIDATQVISKVYDYMCFGKPVLYFYKFTEDVNLKAFEKYPYFKAFNTKLPSNSNDVILVEIIIDKGMKELISYNDVERMFPSATASAYLDIISKVVND